MERSLECQRTLGDGCHTLCDRKTAGRDKILERLLLSKIGVKSDLDVGIGIAGVGPRDALQTAQHHFQTDRAGHAGESLHRESLHFVRDAPVLLGRRFGKSQSRRGSSRSGK